MRRLGQERIVTGCKEIYKVMLKIHASGVQVWAIWD